MRRLLPRTLAGRLVTTAVLLVAVTTVLIGAAATVAIRSYLTDELDEDLRRTSQRAAAAVVRGLPLPVDPLPDDGRGGPFDRRGRGGDRVDDFGFGQRVGTLTAYVSDTTSTGIVLSAEDRDVQWSALSDEVLGRLDGLPGDDGRTVRLPGLGDYRVRVDSVAGGTLVSGLPMDAVDATVRNLTVIELVLAAAGIGAAGLAAHGIVRRQLRPLREVASTAHEVAGLPLSEGEIGVTARVPERLADEQSEVGQVGAALNRLLGHVEKALDERHRSEQQVRRFVADASHELRTPLAVISGYAELSRRTDGPDPRPERDLEHNMEKVRAESARMSALVDDLLLLARLDAGRPLESGEVDLTRLMVESVADARVVAPDHHWVLDLPEAPVLAAGDEQRLHQVIGNLLSNSRRHTPPGTRVTAGVRRGPDGTAELTVEDDGPGIAPAVRDQVFERFARGDTARTRAAGGTGLGLSLVKAIVEAHRGSIDVESSPGRTRFTVVLPTV